MTGKTDLHNRTFVATPQKLKPSGGNGTYSTVRTASKARAVARLHKRVADNGEWVYLITHTMSDAAGDDLRRKMFRRFVDRIRKLEHFAGYMWTTERHKRGQLHHHLVLRMRKPWQYRKVIVGLSMRYCGSVNGLDVSDHGCAGSRGVAYASKGFAYACKDAAERKDKLPFRWWGTSRIRRSVRVADELLPPLLAMASANNWVKCAYVSSQWAVSLCAYATELYEWERICARRKKYVGSSRRIKTPGKEEDERVSMEVGHEPHNPTCCWG